jgi:hypothetical protein
VAPVATTTTSGAGIPHQRPVDAHARADLHPGSGQFMLQVGNESAELGPVRQQLRQQRLSAQALLRLV